jgi:peroxiredoxin Q/BCP
MMLKAGDKAPALSLKDGEGRTVRLSDLKGKKVVLYFYPRDMTPGCTKESVQLPGRSPQIPTQGRGSIGSIDRRRAVASKFSEKYGLKFPLLSDPEHATADRYGVWQEKNMYGKKVWGMKRTTFIIDENGKIAHVFNKVTPDIHSKEVLDALAKLDVKP